MKINLPLHIVLQSPPAGIDYGLQKGSGSKYQTVQIQRSTRVDLHFTLDADIRGDSQKDAQPAFTGPFAQGPAPNKFIYIDIGAFAGQVGGISRRLKIPLKGITWEMVEELSVDSKLVLETHVPGAGKDGSPNCATVKPFGGWRVKKPAG